MAFNVYHNPIDVKLDDRPIPNVQSIVVSVRYHETQANRGDGSPATSARFTYGRTSGIITLLDSALADVAWNRAGTLSFVWKDQIVTISDCSIGGYEPAVYKEAGTTITIPFIAESAPRVSKGEPTP